MNIHFSSKLIHLFFCFLFITGTLISRIQLPLLNSTENQMGLGNDRVVVNESEEMRTRRKAVVPTLDLTVLDNQKDFAEQLYACGKEEKKPVTGSQVLVREIITVPLGIYAPPFVF